MTGAPFAAAMQSLLELFFNVEQKAIAFHRDCIIGNMTNAEMLFRIMCSLAVCHILVALFSLQ